MPRRWCARRRRRCGACGSIRPGWSSPAGGSSSAIPTAVRCGGCAPGCSSPAIRSARRGALADEFDDDPTPDVLAAAIAEGATVVTVGFPDQSWRPLTRRGDVYVLAVDAGHRASAFVQRLERADVAADVVPAEGAAAAVASADLVLVEADAVGRGQAVAPIGSAVARRRGVRRGRAGVARGRAWPAPARPDDRGDGRPPRRRAPGRETTSRSRCSWCPTWSARTGGRR